MKTKFVIFKLVLAFISVNGYSQIDWGPDIKIKTGINGVFSQVVSSSSEGVYGFREKVGYAALFGELDWFIVKYDPDDLTLNEVHSLFPKGYFSKGKSQPSNLEGILHMGKRKFLFFSNYEKKKFSAYVVELDHDYNIQSEEPIMLDQVEVQGAFSKGYYNVEISEDESHILLYYLTPFKRYEKERFRYMILDPSSRFEKVAEQEISLEIQDKDFAIVDMQAVGKSEVYLLALVSYDKQEKKWREKKDPKYYYSFHKYNYGEEEQVDEYKIELNKKFINSLAFGFTENEIVVGGFYGEKNSSNINGIYYMRINQNTGEQVVSDTYEFSKEFIGEFYSEKQVERADKKGKDLEVPKMVFRSFVVQEDGSALLVAEQHYVRVSCYTDSRGGTRCQYYHYYNDIVVAHVNSAGEIEWTKKIPKKSVQVTGSMAAPPQLGFTMAETEDYLYFFFNDNIVNANYTDAEKVKQMISLKKSAIVMVTISKKDGADSKEMLQSQEKAKLFFLPQRSSQLQGSNEMIFFASTLFPSKERLGRFALPR